MNNVVKLELIEMGENLRFDPDQTLEDAKGHDFVTLLVIGELALITIERIKHSLIFGDE